jgi:hypothetical protein
MDENGRVAVRRSLTHLRLFFSKEETRDEN